MRKSAKIIYSLLFLVISSAVLSSYSYYSFNQVEIIFKEQNNQFLTQILLALATQVEAKEVDALKSLTEKDPLYEKAVTPLRLTHDPLRGSLRYVYTLYVKEDQVHFGLDTAPYVDTDNDGKVDHSELGSLYEDAPVEVFEAYKSKQIVISPNPYSDSYGTFVSAYKPIIDEKDQVVGVLAVDQTIEKYLQSLEILKRRVLWAYLLMEVLVMCISAGIYFLIGLLESRALSERLLRDQETALIQAAKMTEMGILTASITHEINNPLNVISLHAAQLKKNSNDETVHLAVEKMERALGRIQQTIKHIKNFVRKENEEFESVDLDQVICDTLDFISVRTKFLDIRKEIEVNGVIRAHPTQISQVLINLIVNASEAMEEGKVQNPWVKIRTFRRDIKTIGIEISNAGPPMPMELWNKVSTGFFTTKERGKGSGLGILISRRIVESHHGKFNFTIQNDHTTFIIELPFREDTRAA